MRSSTCRVGSDYGYPIKYPAHPAGAACARQPGVGGSPKARGATWRHGVGAHCWTTSSRPQTAGTAAEVAHKQKRAQGRGEAGGAGGHQNACALQVDALALCRRQVHLHAVSARAQHRHRILAPLRAPGDPASHRVGTGCAWKARRTGRPGLPAARRILPLNSSLLTLYYIICVDAVAQQQVGSQ